MEEYVFGLFKDETTNLIPTYDKAMQLLRMFAASPRQFEIIACDTDDCGHGLTNLITRLGYDVAGIGGDCWSIVDDFSESRWARTFGQKLNGYQLFESKQDAVSYLTEYKKHKEADFDNDFVVVEVWSTT